MTHRLLLLLFILLASAPVWARRTAASRYVPTPDAALDSVVLRVNRQLGTRGIGHLDELQLDAHIWLTSCNQQRGIAGRLVPHLLRFNGKDSVPTLAEGVLQAHYRWPGDVGVDLLDWQSNNRRRAPRYLREFRRIMLPLSSLTFGASKSKTKSFVVPFSDQGLRRYTYYRDTLNVALLHYIDSCGLPAPSPSVVCIHFTPKHRHHNLIEGVSLIDTTTSHILATGYTGRIDMGRVSGLVILRNDSTEAQQLMPLFSRTRVDYHYGKTRGYNLFDSQFQISRYQPRANHAQWQLQQDLSEAYAQRPTPYSITGLWQTDSLTASGRPELKGSWAKTLRRSEYLLDGGRLGDDRSSLRIYSPLDPTGFGYSASSGFSLRQRIRWDHVFHNGQNLSWTLEAGYAFGRHEFRYGTDLMWEFQPSHRGRLQLSMARRHAGFSSKFIDAINNELKHRHDSIDFTSLGIDYFINYEGTLEVGREITNGLMLYGGVRAAWRTPVRHGVFKMAEERRQELMQNNYNDLCPFLRVEWTPLQYYIHEGRRKIYVESPSPTLSVEVSRTVPVWTGGDANYGRVEADLQQSIRYLSGDRFCYRVGAGSFFRQEGEYFINYRYFADGLYPSTWHDEHIGGFFHLLDQYWYNSSPSYVQLHGMLETSFGLLHLVRPLSKYIIKERLYASALWAEGKNSYMEYGYGIANNYISCGFFVGLKGLGYYGSGFKFRIELGNHL